MILSNFLRRSGSIDTPNLVIFSMVTRLPDNRGTNINFLLPK